MRILIDYKNNIQLFLACLNEGFLSSLKQPAYQLESGTLRLEITEIRRVYQNTLSQFNQLD